MMNITIFVIGFLLAAALDRSLTNPVPFTGRVKRAITGPVIGCPIGLMIGMTAGWMTTPWYPEVKVTSAMVDEVMAPAFAKMKADLQPVDSVASTFSGIRSDLASVGVSVATAAVIAANAEWLFRTLHKEAVVQTTSSTEELRKKITSWGMMSPSSIDKACADFEADAASASTSYISKRIASFLADAAASEGVKISDRPAK